MIKVVLDANIFISAVIKSPSNPATILELVKKKKIILISSDEILSEVKTALLYPKLRKIHHRTTPYCNGHILQTGEDSLGSFQNHVTAIPTTCYRSIVSARIRDFHSRPGACASGSSRACRGSE